MNRISMRRACARALALACIATQLHGCAVAPPPAKHRASERPDAEDFAERGPQLPPGSSRAGHTYMCHARQLGIRFISGNQDRMEGSCFEIDAHARFRMVSGDCRWNHYFEGECPEVKR